MGGKRVLVMFCKAEPTGIQDCTNVISMKGHSLNLCTKLPGRRFHSGRQCTLNWLESQLSVILLSSSLISLNPTYFPFRLFYLPKCGGARCGRCLITHEHHQLKWSSENDVNLWHLWKCQWVFRGSDNGRERPIRSECFYCVNVSPIPTLPSSEDLRVSFCRVL